MMRDEPNNKPDYFKGVQKDLVEYFRRLPPVAYFWNIVLVVVSVATALLTSLTGWEVLGILQLLALFVALGSNYDRRYKTNRIEHHLWLAFTWFGLFVGIMFCIMLVIIIGEFFCVSVLGGFNKWFNDKFSNN